MIAVPDKYRRHAAECVRLAQKAQNPRDKALLLAMADSWIRLSEEVAKRGLLTRPEGAKKQP